MACGALVMSMAGTSSLCPAMPRDFRTGFSGSRRRSFLSSPPSSSLPPSMRQFQHARRIPIICPALADAVHLGLIASEARPGGNVTGIEPYVAGLPAKQIEVAREIAPGAKRIGLLTNLRDPKAPPQRHELRAAAKALELTIVEADANSPGEIEPAMQALTSSPIDVLIVLQTGLFLGAGHQIAQLAAAKRLPTVYGYREHVVAGGLISYALICAGAIVAQLTSWTKSCTARRPASFRWNFQRR